jgi:hypothetical protein
LVVSSSIVVLKDSIVTRNVGAKGGALLIAESRVSLANTTFGNNIALNGKASDVLIAATASAFDGGTFVRCDMGSFVNFCNGVAKGIFIPPQQTNIPNTNCNVDAISNPTSSLCAAVAV